MKFKGNNPIRKTVHPVADKEQVRYPEPIAYPADYKTIEDATTVESDEGDPADAEGSVPVTPPLNNLLIFHNPRKPKAPPKHNI